MKTLMLLLVVSATAYGADTNQVESVRCNILAVAVPKPPGPIRPHR